MVIFVDIELSRILHYIFGRGSNTFFFKSRDDGCLGQELKIESMQAVVTHCSTAMNTACIKMYV